MTKPSTYFVPLFNLPTVILAPGPYLTRCGEVVLVTVVSPRHDFGCCHGVYPNGVAERWHRSGRIMASRETENDIVRESA
jgi:hypothetical protein